MKKTAILLGVMLFLFLGCVSTSLVKEQWRQIPLDEENLLLLKREWEGWPQRITVGAVRENQSGLEILNHTLPLKGTLTNYWTASGEKSYPFDNGVIEKGCLFIKWSRYQWLRLAFYESPSEKLELRGEYWWNDRIDASGGTFVFYPKPKTRK